MAQAQPSLQDELVIRYKALVEQVNATLPESLQGEERLAALRAALDQQALKDVETYVQRAEAELQTDEDVVRVELGKIPVDHSAARAALDSL
jgi:ABC-type uncharacterized transport system YnjBCD ATPase subunit